MTNIIGRTLLNQFRVDEFIASGGMGAVYKVWDLKRSAPLAMKVLHADFAEDPSSFKYFQREARALQKLQHPNIVPFYGIYQTEQIAFLLEHYIDGPSLKEVMQKYPKGMPVPEVLVYMQALCSALGYAHANGVVHCDIKPANVMVDRGGQVFLADFGIARHAESSTTTIAGAGTPSYMSPEQITANAVVPASDVYSLGVLLYEMVTGQRPFRGEEQDSMGKGNTSGERIRYSHLHLPAPDPRITNPSIPGGLAQIVMKCMAKATKDRYAYTGELLTALNSLGIEAQHRVQVPVSHNFPEDTLQRNIWSDGNVRQRNIVMVILGAIFIFGLIAIVLSRRLNSYSKASPAPSDTQGLITAQSSTSLPIDKTPYDPPPKVMATDTFIIPLAIPSDTLVPTPAKPRGGNWIAFHSRISGNAEIYLVDINGKNRKQLTKNSAHDLYPSWSSDGKFLVYQTNEGGDQELAIVDIETREITQLTRNECDDWGPSWSPADDWIAYYSNCDGERNIYKIRADGSGITQLTNTSGSYSWFPVWSPDGRKISFSSNRSGKYRIYVMDADGGNPVDLASGCVSYFSPDGMQIVYGVYCDDTDDLWIMNSDGSEKYPLTDGFECKNAVWSPDGGKILFQFSPNGKEGPYGLYIMSLEKLEKKDWRLLVDFDVDGRSPAWQP